MGAKQSVINQINKSSTGSIRVQFKDDSISASAGLVKTLRGIAERYCAAVNTTPETIEECVYFVRDHFSGLTLDDLVTAFQLAAKREIEADLNSYFGHFSVKLLGEVLADYTEYRNAVARDLRQAEEREAYARQNHTSPKLNDPAFRRMLDIEFDQRLRRMAEDAVPFEAIVSDHSDNVISAIYRLSEKILEYQYRCLDSDGRIRLTKEQRWQLFDRAGELVAMFLRRQKAGAISFSESKSIARLLENTEGQDFQTKQKILARKLAVICYLADLKYEHQKAHSHTSNKHFSHE